MCSIFGIQTKKKYNLKKICVIANKCLSHRGPDENNVWYDQNVGIAHNRLSIIDIKNGQQPMMSSNKRYIISFNGEIVNFKELRKSYLQNLHLKSNSDTEVLIELFSKFGPKMLDLIKGMFALAIYDKLNKTFFLARDHIGIKPLYYYKENELLMFSSEIKAIYKTKIKEFQINKEKINEFLVHGSVYGKNTLHKNIFELQPGHYLTGSSKEIKEIKYWDVHQFRKSIDNFSSTKIDIEKNLNKIIKEWCNSDVKMGSLLSGGLDSTYVSTIASKYKEKIEMFTNYFPDRKKEDNEVFLASIVAKATKNKHHKVQVKDIFSTEKLEKLVNHLADPLQDLNSISFMALCEYIKTKSKVKVILTGEGSDELFAGYQRHFDISNIYRDNKNFEDILLSKNYHSVNRLKYFLNTKYTLPLERKNIYKQFKNKKYNALQKVLLHDQMTFLPGYLDRVDKISMMYGLESRTPFLDERFISISNSCKSEFKIKKTKNFKIQKYILRKIFQKFVSKKIVWNKKKYQFNYPTSASFQDGELNNIYKELINNNSKISIFYPKKGLLNLLRHHENNFADHSNLLGRLLTLEMFANLKF